MQRLFGLCLALVMLTNCGTEEGEKTSEQKRAAKTLVDVQPSPDGTAQKRYELKDAKGNFQLTGGGEGDVSPLTIYRDVRVTDGGTLTTRCLEQLDPEMTLGIIACKDKREIKADIQVKHVRQVCTILDDDHAPSEPWPLQGECPAGFEVFTNNFNPRLLIKAASASH